MTVFGLLFVILWHLLPRLRLRSGKHCRKDGTDRFNVTPAKGQFWMASGFWAIDKKAIFPAVYALKKRGIGCPGTSKGDCTAPIRERNTGQIRVAAAIG